MVRSSNNKRILYSSIFPNSSSKRLRGLYELYKLYLKKIFNKIEIIDLYNYNNCYHLPIGLIPK